MARRRHFLDITCVDAARERIRHVYDTFDTVCVQFSGGKDSTAALYLAREVHEERGLGPVKAIFRDEEMVSPATARFIEQVRQYPWVDLEWFCLPQAQEVWALGKREYVLLWSPQRARSGRLIREMPPWAITAEDFGLDPSVPIPESIDHYTMQGKEGRVAFITGVRANESMLRYLAVTRRTTDNYINRPWGLSKKVPLWFAKVIYDWTTDDVLKFLIEECGADYSSYYDYAALGGANLRVGIPLHAVAARRISDVVATEPEFYDRLIEVYPRVDGHRRLWREVNPDRLVARYAEAGWDGVEAFIQDYALTPGLRAEAQHLAADFRRHHDADPSAFPISSLLRAILLRDYPSISAKSLRRNRRSTRRDDDADDLDRWDDTR